ncbi:MAG TPA: molybdopterin converting factor subunit 1 [Vicinamibacteria bacterium]|nr:molybdopterin converting factor subunit 1 [Vicinamibacteria bacterium]
MRVRVRLFAGLREVAGADHLDVELPRGTTVHGLWQKLVSGNQKLAAYGGSVQFAVNHDFVKSETELAPDDEIAFLPPVSGG